jgi:putative transposase
MHLGWALVHGAPTAKDALLCLERTFFSKKDDLDRLGVETDLDLYGLAMSIYFDNGPEAKNERMRNLTRLRITTFYCASRNPAGKPHIERSNLSLKKDMRILRGSTQLNGVDGQRDPEAEGDDLMDIAELEKWIVEWLFIKWPNKPLERHQKQALVGKFRGHTAAQVLRNLEAENFVMPLPPNLKDWKLVKYERRSLTLNRKTGITIGEFHFAGPNLPRLIERYGENKVPVLVDPDDFRFVLVADGDEVDLVRLINTNIHESTPAYSYVQAKEFLRSLPPDESGLEKAKAFDRNTFENSVGATKNRNPPKGKRAKTKEAQTRAKHDAAVDRAVRNPVTPPSQEQGQTSTNVGAMHVSMKDVGVFEVKKSSPKAGDH